MYVVNKIITLNQGESRFFDTLNFLLSGCILPLASVIIEITAQALAKNKKAPFSSEKKLSSLTAPWEDVFSETFLVLTSKAVVLTSSAVRENRCFIMTKTKNTRTLGNYLMGSGVLLYSVSLAAWAKRATNSPTGLGASLPCCSTNSTTALPTMTPWAYCPICRTCSGPEMPKPMA